MIKIKGVIRYKQGIRILHDLNMYTLFSVLEEQITPEPIILVISVDNEIGYYDFNLMLQNKILSVEELNSFTWNDLEEKINELLDISEYNVLSVSPEQFIEKGDDTNIVAKISKSPYLSDSNSQFKIYSLDNTAGFRITITDTHNLVIERDDSLVNFKNAIVIINGVVCYNTIQLDGSLLVHNGAKYLVNRNPVTSNGILIDTTELGDIENIKLSDCTFISNICGCNETETTIDIDNRKGPKIIKNDIFYGTNSNILVQNDSEYISFAFEITRGIVGIPMLVLFGRLFTPMHGLIKTVVVDEQLKVYCHIPRLLLENILASNTLRQGKFNTFKADINSELTLENIKANAFVVLLHNDANVNLNYIKPIFTIGGEKIFFSQNQGGLLFNTKTHEIIDYTRSHYLNGTLVTINKQPNLYRIINTNINETHNETVYTSFAVEHPVTDIYENLHDTQNLILLDFSFEKEISPTRKEEYVVEEESTDYPEGYELLIAKQRAAISITVKDHSAKILTLQDIWSDTLDNYAHLLEDLCGDYTLDSQVNSDGYPLNSFDKCVWFKDNNKASWCLYYHHPYWYIGKQNKEPIYRSGDAEYNQMFPYTEYLPWFVADNVNPHSGDIKITYIDKNNILISNAKSNINGVYTLKDHSAIYAKRVWKHSNKNIEVFYDKHEYVWAIEIINDNSRIRVYKSEKALVGSSPWHNYKYTYLLEE